MICKNAKVTTVYINPRGAITHPMLECRINCPVCGGAGWTEEAVVAVSEVRGQVIATHAAADNETEMEHMLIDWLDSLKEANDGR